MTLDDHLGITEEELDARLGASRAACGVPERVEDEAVCGRLARWIAATTPIREAAMATSGSEE
jgi:hypothetical protein